MKVIISCEHGGNQIPHEYQSFFANESTILQTHFGFDIGALSIAKELAKKSDYFIFSEISRLLVDLNRSSNNKNLFSKYSASFDAVIKNQVIQQYYVPYRNQIVTEIEKLISQGHQVIHVSVHSFTPILNDVTRQADVGLLYDPKRVGEKNFSRTWQQILRLKSNYNVRLNYPYLGTSDGLTTLLRKKFDKKNYLGIELEMNQKIFTGSNIEVFKQHIIASFFETVSQQKNNG